MKKIMFNDKYYLTQAVLDGTKTMTRRVLREGTPLGNWKETAKCLPYKVGDIVSIAQSYKTIYEELEPQGNWEANEWWCSAWDIVGGGLDTSAGYRNKMFVRADFMIHHIKITDVKVERLQDISDKECLCEGVKRASIGFYAEGVKVKDWEKEAHRETASGCLKLFPFPRQAFASLIDKVSGKGTWESNPFVVAYSFELVD